jgi:Protein of unknown function (DUF3040)
VSLPAGQQRTLQRIEQALLADDAGLESLFAVFTRLAEHDAMPRAEQVASRLQRALQRPAAVMVIAVTALLGILVLAILPRGGQACGAAPARAVQLAVPRSAGCLPGLAPQSGPPHAR